MKVQGDPLRTLDGGLLSVLPAEDEGAPYDRKAATYDRMVGSTVYNRLAWGIDPSDYSAFAAEALASGSGPLVDLGCGSGVFTADVYRDAQRPVVMVDRSVAMLRRAHDRLAGSPATLVQADLLDLPFERRSFDTVCCFGTLHVLDDPWPALEAAWRLVAPGGRLFVSMLVTDRAVGRAYLGALHRAGEVGPGRELADLAAAARRICGPSAAVDRTGSMAWLRATQSP